VEVGAKAPYPHFARMNGVEFLRCLLHGSLVIGDDFDGIRIPGAPCKADTPLVVDPDAVLPGTIAFQNF
jgi:hypothetical protein